MNLLDKANVSEKISGVKNILKATGGDLTGDFGNMRNIRNLLKGLTNEQVEAAVTSGEFDKQTANVLLRLKGYKKDVADAATATGKFVDVAEEGGSVLSNLGKEVGQFGKDLLGGLKEILIFLGTNPVGWIIDVVAAMGIAYATYKKFNTSAKEANENINNAFTESKNQLKSVQQQKETVDQLAESYEKLSKGVNTSTNENISLNTDSYKEYLDVCNQIADMYPELVSGYDAQGNAILSLKGNVDQLTDSYKQAQEEAYATAYYGVEDEKGKRTGGTKDRQKALDYVTDTFDSNDNVFTYLGQYVGQSYTKGKIETTTNELMSTYSKMLKMSDDELYDFVTDTSANASMAAKQFVDTISDGSKESCDAVRKETRQILNELQSGQTEVLKEEQTALEGYMKGVSDAGGTALASGYDKLTEKQQSLATSLLSSLTFNDLQGFQNSDDFEKAEQEWVNNIVSSISTMSAEAKNAYDELQDSIANPSDLTSAGINKIDGYLNTLSDELGVTKDKLKDILNLDDIFDTQSSFEKNIDKYLGKGGYDKLISQAEKGVDSAQAYKDAMETANKTLREQNQQEAKELQKQQDEQEKLRKQSQKDHENAMETANATMRKQRQEAAKEEQKQSEESQNAHIKAMETANARLRQLNKERADESKKSEKEVSDNIKQVYAERDAAVQKSMDNIEQRNKQVADNAAAELDKYNNAVLNSNKQTGKYSGISGIDQDYKNSQDKFNPWKQFEQEYMKYQQEAHKNDKTVVQAEADNMKLLGGAVKSVWDSYIDAQQKAHANDDQITKASVDNANVVGDKLKSVWDKYTEGQKKAHAYDDAVTQSQIQLFENVKNKAKEFGSAFIDSQQETHKNDSDIVKYQTEQIEKAKSKYKELGTAALESQAKANQYNADTASKVIKTISDNAEKAKNKIKEVVSPIAEQLGSGHSNDMKAIQEQAKLFEDAKNKIEKAGSSFAEKAGSGHSNDADVVKNASATADLMKNAFNAVKNSAPVTYIKDTVKDINDINKAVVESNIKVQQLEKANKSANNTAVLGANQVIDAQNKLDTVTKAAVLTEKERQDAQDAANKRLAQQRKEQTVQQAEAQAQAQKESQEEDKRYKLETKKANQQSKDEAVAAKKEKEKQAQAEKTERQEKRRADATQQRIKNEISAAQKEKDAQKWISDNLNNMTVSQMKMWNEAALGADTAAQAVDNYNKLLQDNAMNTMSIDIDSVTEHINNLNTALSESASATGLTADSISNLKSMFSGLEGYDSATLFMNTANGVKVNREELEKLNQEYADQNASKAQEQLGLLQDKYNDLTEQINTCSDASQAANLYAQRDAVLDQIHDVQSLISQYDGLTSAFNEWQNAQSQTSPGANYDSMYSYIETANKLAADGKWGASGLKEYMELISGQDLSEATPKDMAEVWDNLGSTIDGTSHNLMEFLTEDKSGIEAFIDTLKELDKGYIQVGEDGQYIFKADNMDQLASDLGTDVSYVQVLLDKLSEYGWDIQVDSTDLDLATDKAEAANKELQKIGATDYTFNFNADVDSIDEEIQKAKELINDPRFKDANGNFDINIKGASEAQQVLVALLAQKEALTNSPIIMDIDTSKLSGKNQEVISDLKTLQSTLNQYNIQVDADVHMDTSEVEKQVGDALDAIDEIPDDMQRKLGLANQKVKDAAKLLKQNIADGVKLDDNALKTIQDALDNISPEILASLGINVDDVQKTVDATAQSFETALTNVLDNLQITINGKKIEFSIGADTSEADAAFDNLQQEKGLYTSGWQAAAGLDNQQAMQSAQEAESELTQLGNMNPTPVVSANTSGANSKFDETKGKAKEVTNNGSPWMAYVRAEVSGASSVQGLLDKLKSGFQKIGAGIWKAIASVNNASVAENNASKGKTSSGKGGHYSQGAVVNGSFHGYASGTNVSLSKNETAIVNEVGTEGLLRNGVLTELPGGAHLEKLQKGDIIFNHLQMEQLRRYGYVTANGGHGQLIGGYAYGTLTGTHGYATLKDNYYGSGSGTITTGTKQYGSGSSSSTSKSGSSSSKSSSGSSSTKSSKNSSGSSNTSSSSTTEEAEKTEETLDWIETKISRVERLITNLGKTVSATYRSWSDRNKALSSEISDVNSEISVQQQAYNRYMQQANSVGLDAGYAQKVRDGKIDIETITDEDLKQKIEDYKNWYEKAIACSDAILDLKDDLYDLAKTNFDNITKQFEDQLNVIEHSVNMVEGYIDLAETRGYLASTDYYDSLIKTETQNIGTLKNEYDALANTLNNMTNSGQIAKYSEAWYELYSQICDVEEALQDATKALSEYESKMRELKWSYFEKEQDYITNFTDETQWLVDLLEKQGKLVDDNNGKLTNRGTATMGLHAVGYNTYMAQADDYAKEIQKINQELAKDPYNIILIDKRQEYLKAQRDAIDNAYDELDATKSLIKEGYDAQIDALQNLIDKKKDAMQAEKDLYDYQKSISQKVESLSSYEKQRIAYEGDNSEEGMAKRQQLDKNIKDTKQDLQDAEYEQWLSDQQQLLDTLVDDYQEFLNQRLDDINFILNTMLESANQNSESIKTTLVDATASVGTNLSDTMNTVWTSNSGLNGIVTAYGNGFNNALTTTNKALASIEAMIKSMVQEAQKKAAEDAAKQAAAAKAVQAQTPKVNSTSNNNNNNNSNKSNSNGSFFIPLKDSYPKERLNKEQSIVDFS